MSRAKIDWEQLRREYAEGASFRDLGAKYGIDHSGIGKRAKREGWQQDRKDIVHETTTKLKHTRARAHAEIGETRADVLHQTEQAALKLADVLDKATSYLLTQDPVVMAKASRELASLSVAMKNNTQLLMDLYGLMDPYRKRQIEIAQAKLDMEKADRDAETHKEPRTIRIEDLAEEEPDGDSNIPAE